VSVRGLTYTYPNGTRALDGIDFDLHAGESVVLLGPNGSGKTTFVLHLNGLLRSSGDVVVCGLPVSQTNLAAIRRRVGIVFQNSDDQLFMPTILDDVMFGPVNLGLSPLEANERALRALRAAGVHGGYDRAPWNLSAGEKRRVAVAGVLAMEPDILVLDEPTMFLDPPGRRDLIATLRSLPQARIVVTHDAGFARGIATRAVFFQEGKIVAHGSVDELVRQFEWDV
jgi:cobalt/nickel transport system ATP-binding protein